MIDIILYNKKEDRYIPRFEQYTWKHGVMGGEIDEQGHRKAYKMIKGEKESILSDLRYIPIVEYSGIKDLLELKIGNIIMSIYESRTNTGGKIYYDYKYDYFNKTLGGKEVIFNTSEELKEKVVAALREMDEAVRKMKRIDKSSNLSELEQFANNGYAIYRRERIYLKELEVEKIDFSKYEIDEINHDEMRIKVKEIGEKRK